MVLDTSAVPTALRSIVLSLLLGIIGAGVALAQPVNDDLADAVTISSMPFTGSGTNVGATSETDETYPYNSVWWSYTPSQDGILTVDTFGSTFDTTLDLWTGSGHPLTRIVVNTDADGTQQSEVVVAVEASTTYYLRVHGGYYGREGDVALNATLDPPIANDDLAGAVEISSLPFSGSGTNAGATVEGDEASPSYACVSGDDTDNSVWWTYTASQDGILTVDTYGSDFNTNLTVWTGAGHPLTEQVCAGRGTSGDQTQVQLGIEAGETYLIRVAGVYSYGMATEGDVSLNVTVGPPIPNDNLADAIVISALPFAGTGSNVGATMETDEVLPSCESEADNSAWWTYTATEDGTLTVDTDGSSFYITLSLWSGSGHPLSEVGCDESGTNSSVSVPITAGQTYQIRVAGTFRNNNSGDITLNLTFNPPLENDDLAEAIEILSVPYTTTTATNLGAVGEPDEMSSDCSSSSGALNAVWWTYTPSQDGILTVDTDGSNFDRVLSLWTGSAHPLTERSCTDDSPETLVRSVTAGQTYHIRVSGFSESGEGDIAMSVTLDLPLPNDDLADAHEITSLPFSEVATNVGATLEPDEESPSCESSDPVGTSVWWSYTATQEGKLTIDTDGSTFDLVMSVWTGAEHPLTSRGCTDNDDGGAINVSPGTTYLLRISGYDFEDTGDIHLAVTFSLPDPVYVDDGASGNNDGSSWTDAYTDLHDALADGAPEIWVAQGTYSNGGTAFTLENGRRVYGGFAGTETARSERGDPRQYESVLTGAADHVVYARSVGGTTLLDGFTIRDGTAGGSGTGAHGGGFFCNGRNTGANFDGFCNPKLRNLLFENNSADDDGGALYLDGRDGGNAGPSLTNVVFRGNTADDGGAIYINAENLGFGSPDLQNVVFAENEAGRGGAIYSWAGLEGTASPTIINALFVNNTALSGGGAFFNSQAGGAGGWATPVLTNATFVGNNADNGDVLFNYKMGDGEGEVAMHNAIFRANNDSQTNASIFNQAGGTTTIADGVIDRLNDVCTSAVTCTRVVVEDPDFANEGTPDGADGRYATADDGLRLAGYSPAVDAGNFLPNTSARDVLGNQRVFGGTIDLGAYEYAVYEGESDAPDVGATTGFFRLGSTGATVLFTSNESASGGLTAHLNAATPTGDGLPSNVAPTFWTINAALDGSFTYNVTFDVADVEGIDDFSLLEVFKSDDGGQTWASVAPLIHDADRKTITVVGLTSFSDFAVGDDSNPLPVELAAFEGQRDAERVNLTWETASETNNAGFHVERRTAAGWSALGFVDGRGTTDAPQSYRFTDARLPFAADSLSYRLRQVDLDGTATVTDEVVVRLGRIDQLVLHAPFPNPARQGVSLRYELPDSRQTATVEINVYNVLGQRVATLANGSQKTGRVEQRVDTSRWSSGLYFVRLQAGSDVRTERLVVVR